MNAPAAAAAASLMGITQRDGQALLAEEVNPPLSSSSPRKPSTSPITLTVFQQNETHTENWKCLFFFFGLRRTFA